jgi:PIN domain nuclease of toxin-antitoxin system
MTVLDASALLAFLFGEPGHQAVAELIPGSCISSVNFAEVLGRFARDGHDVRRVAKRLEDAGIEVVPFVADDAAVAASLRPTTDPLGLSLGDRACLALALTRSLPAITADQAWRKVKVGVDIRIVR